jgi:choline dehydrogenase-like flavoprotein
MSVHDLNLFEQDSVIEADLCIVGTGPAGLSIAKTFAGTSTKVVLVESGGQSEEPATQALYEIEAEPPRRINQDVIRRRMLGGSSRIWTGRCAPFQELDFERRSWVPNSGWPIARKEFEPWLAPAGAMLGLGPNCYDDETLWPFLRSPRPSPRLNADFLEPMFWQFSKSPRNPKNSIDFGQDRLDTAAPNIDLLLHANLTHIDTNAAGTRFECAEVRTLCGKRSWIRAKTLVLCCGGVENARLLLASNRILPRGVGNQYDTVGRFLMDHTDSAVGYFDPVQSTAVRARFGHYWLDNEQGRHVYLHGLALSRQIQQREQLLNCHAYVDAFDVEADDPWFALDRAKAALRSRQGIARVYPDARVAMSHCGELVRGLYRRRFRHRPQLQKLKRVELRCILEQIPDPESRVTLSETRKDALGMPLSKIKWKVSDMERKTARRMTELMCSEFKRFSLPAPALTSCLDDHGGWLSACAEKAHPTGSTRMSDNPKKGVVNQNCQVHGVDGLFIAGSSVFPTSGAANPTLMIVAQALRLADRLRTHEL